MKTKITIVIESPDKIEVYPEEGQTKEDFKGEEKEKELKEFQEGFTIDLHNTVVGRAKRYFDDEHFEDDVIENMDEQSIEGYESFNDYEIKIKTTSEGEGE